MSFNNTKAMNFVNKDEKQDPIKSKQTYKSNLTTGDLFNVMWRYTVKQNPKYEEINNNSFRHAILGCSRAEAEERIYQYYKNKKV